jgi:hypothetical protein
MSGMFSNGMAAMKRAAAFVTALWVAVFLSIPAMAAPEAHILRIDPRASQESGDPIITMVVEVVQSKRVSETVSSCATLTGDANLACMSAALEKPYALYAPFPFPSEQAVFTVSVDGTDRPAKYLSHKTWGESSREPGVGTAWLILVDADRRMGNDFGSAKAVASEFVSSMGPNDIVNVMFFNDRQVVQDSKWLPAQKKAAAQSFIDSVTGTYANQGRNRSLLTIIKTAATDGFKGLGNVGDNVKVPLHQAMVVLSSGFGGADPSTTGPGAMQLSQYMTGGRFPEDNTALPKAPVPVISIYFPYKTVDEFRQNSLEFMQNLANSEIGGFFSIVQSGGSERGKSIVKAIRTRFSKMYAVKWRVSCIAPSITQSFKLVFNNVNPPILGDNSFKDVPVGIDPSTWPLDVNLDYTKQLMARNPLYPGGKFRVYGDFCWGGDTSRAEVYFLPAGQQPATDMQGADLEKAKRTQQQLIAQGLRGKALETTDTFVEFEAPDNDKLIHGQGENAIARVLIYDNKAHRTSGLTAETILEVKASSAPLPILWILGGAFGLVVVALLLLIVLRSGGRGKQRSMSPPPAPVVAGRPPVVAAGAAPMTGSATRATLQGAPGLYTVGAGQEVRVGRDASQCTVLLTDPRCSTVHASLKLENGVLYVRDEGSNNGTFVNEAPVGRGVWSPVPQNALVRFGPSELSVRLE